MEIKVAQNLLATIALRDMAIFPGMVTHFDLGREKSIRALKEAEGRGEPVFLVAQLDSAQEEPSVEELYEVGTISAVKQVVQLPGGIYRVLVEGLSRGIRGQDHSTPEYLAMKVFPVPEEESGGDAKVEALMRLVEEDVASFIELTSKVFPGVLESVMDHSTPGRLADTAAGYLELPLTARQEILSAFELEERLMALHKILVEELEVLSLENEIDQQVKSQMAKAQKEYYLKEQMDVIRRELDSEPYEDSDIEGYREKLAAKELPQEVRDKAEEELVKLGRMNYSAPEYAMTSSYIDWILSLPWLESQEESVDIKRARKILDEDHYGLEEVKERILEFIALRKKSDTAKGPILCLVGPPGVGKTSIARSVARALDKEYVRMSLGGVTDEAEIRGHRRTYIGSMPGRIISLMKQAGQNNPLFLMDEIDKVSSDYRGDPASGLLEVLDPAQNNTFTDRYMELPFDLSKVFFLTTANSLRTIPAPLLDRMEVISIEGYTPEEKLEIAKNHLWPKALQEGGLKEGEVTLSENSIVELIDFYTREAGVRALEKLLQKIIRKSTLEMLEKGKDRIQVTGRNLTKYVGERKYLDDEMDTEDQVGVVNGLAYTPVGGVTLRIEVNVSPGKGNIQMTGKLGDVMKESAQAALSYIWSQSEALGLGEDYKYQHDIHIHVPDGATPKDGPSAGIAMTTAIYSAITGRKVDHLVAMTGEVTIRGHVLPIGGLKEKLLAAQRQGLKKVLIPVENQRDLKEITSPSLQKLTIVPVKTMEDVFKEALVDHEDQ
ncbi:MAG: endopeptidase La [Tissierellia bacterium]|nr:endopeptidase La [Tissierellia bacterium]